MRSLGVVEHLLSMVARSRYKHLERTGGTAGVLLKETGCSSERLIDLETKGIDKTCWY